MITGIDKDRVAGIALASSLMSPDDWLASTRPQSGSWWPAWSDWLKGLSTATVAAPPMGAHGMEPLCDAPGTYVLG